MPPWLQQGELIAPFGGVHRHQPVVQSIKVLDDGIGHVQRELAVLGLSAIGHDALVKDAGGVRGSRVPGLAGRGGQICHRRQEVRGLIPQPLQGGVVGICDLLPSRCRDLLQQIFGKDAAPVGRVDGGEAGHTGGTSSVGDGGPAVQSPLGVGNDVHLLTAGLRQDLPDTVRQLPPAVLHRGGGLLLSVVHCCAVALELLGNAAPVVDIAEVPEEHPVDQKDRVFRLTDLALRPGGVQLPLLRLELRLVGGDADNLPQIPDVENWDPPAQGRQHPVLQPQLDGGEIHPDHAVPEDDGLQQDSPENAKSRTCNSCSSGKAVLRRYHGNLAPQPYHLHKDCDRSCNQNRRSNSQPLFKYQIRFVGAPLFSMGRRLK